MEMARTNASTPGGYRLNIPGDRYLLFLHGSALNIAANISHARRFQRLRFSVLLVSYRGYGKSDGAFPSEAMVYSDARAAWRYLTEQKGIDPASIFIYGHSLGGAVAIDLATNHPMPQLTQTNGKGAHGRKKCRYLLDVMGDVVRFLANFHQDVSNILIRLFEPVVIFV